MQYPVLTLGEGLGSRVVFHEGSSTHSGGYVVEECDGSDGREGVRLRRLVFLSSQHLAQTKVYMVSGTCTLYMSIMYMFDFHLCTMLVAVLYYASQILETTLVLI